MSNGDLKALKKAHRALTDELAQHEAELAERRLAHQLQAVPILGR